MPNPGILLAYFGYWVAYYGLTQVQGGNWGFLDLGIPKRWTPQTALIPRDGQSGDPAAGKSKPGTVNGTPIP